VSNYPDLTRVYLNRNEKDPIKQNTAVNQILNSVSTVLGIHGPPTDITLGTYGVTPARLTISSTDGNAAIAVTRYSSSGSGSKFLGGRSRGTNISSQVAIQSGDIAVVFAGVGSDGTQFQELASIEMTAEATLSSTSSPGRLVFNTTTPGSTHISEAARIDSNHNIVLGTGQLSTAATNGFIYVPYNGGVPQGIPATAYTGMAPFVYDANDNRLWFYNPVSAKWLGTTVLTSS
jgi:hypothetical protein